MFLVITLRKKIISSKKKKKLKCKKKLRCDAPSQVGVTGETSFISVQVERGLETVKTHSPPLQISSVFLFRKTLHCGGVEDGNGLPVFQETAPPEI